MTEVSPAVTEDLSSVRFEPDDFTRKENAEEIAIDTNFASQSFWKEVRVRFFNKKSAVFGICMILLITIFAIVGPGMNSYTYSAQNLSQKNLAPRIPDSRNSVFSTGTNRSVRPRAARR
jgi:oligopeptide transport system permease protein